MLKASLTHAWKCFGVGWSGATVEPDFGRNCWITPEAVLPIPLPLDVDERLNATGVVGICRGYCFNGTLEPFLSVDNISSRSIYNQRKNKPSNRTMKIKWLAQGNRNKN